MQPIVNNSFSVNPLNLNHSWVKQEALVQYNKSTGLIRILGFESEEREISFQCTLPFLLEELFASGNCVTCYLHLSGSRNISNKSLYMLYHLLGKYQKKGKKVTINWFASLGDTNMLELGNELAELYDLPSNIIPID